MGCFESKGTKYYHADTEAPVHIYVENLPPQVTENEVENVFLRFTNINRSDTIVKKAGSGAYAFVTMKSQRLADHLEKISPVKMFGRQVTIKKIYMPPEGCP